MSQSPMCLPSKSTMIAFGKARGRCSHLHSAVSLGLHLFGPTGCAVCCSFQVKWCPAESLLATMPPLNQDDSFHQSTHCWRTTPLWFAGHHCVREGNLRSDRLHACHAEEAHCSAHVILFTALSATPSTFNSLSNILFISPLSPGRASKSSLSTMRVASKRDRVQVGLDTLCTDPLNFELLPR